MTIFLCGFMGCGKSTIGLKLAKKLSCPFTDMDTYIEKKAGMSIPEIFETKGQEHFRDLETQAVKELADRPGVIACGGGAMLRDENFQTAKQSGSVVFLDVPFGMCYQRIANSDRPIVRQSTRQELFALYEQRKEVYLRHCTHRIEAVHTPARSVQEIVDVLELA